MDDPLLQMEQPQRLHTHDIDPEISSTSTLEEDSDGRAVFEERVEGTASERCGAIFHDSRVTWSGRSRTMWPKKDGRSGQRIEAIERDDGRDDRGG